MNCPKAQRLYLLYLHGKGSYIAYRAHRQACAVCQQELGDMNALAEKQRLRPDFDAELEAWAKERNASDD